MFKQVHDTLSQNDIEIVWWIRRHLFVPVRVYFNRVTELSDDNRYKATFRKSRLHFENDLISKAATNFIVQVTTLLPLIILHTLCLH